MQYIWKSDDSIFAENKLSFLCYTYIMAIIVKTVYSKCYFLIDRLNIHFILFA